jgi:colicin import membrane protein
VNCMAKFDCRKVIFFSVSVLLHVILFGSLFLFFTKGVSYRLPGKVDSSSSIQAQAIDQNKWDAKKKAEALKQRQLRMAQLKRERAQQRQAEMKVQAEKKRQAEAKARQAKKRLAEVAAKKERQRLARLKAKKAAALKHQLVMQKAKKAAALKQKIAQQKIGKAAERKRKEALVRKARQQQKDQLERQLASSQLRQQQVNINKQLMAEQRRIEVKNLARIRQAQRLQAQRNQGVIDKYKALIINAVNRHWRFSIKLLHVKCRVKIRLAPDGTVLSVKLLSGSGNDAFDRSAVQAITNASPLPVPQDSSIFNSNFRVLSFTMSPYKGLLAYH